MEYTYTPRGVCSSLIKVEVDNGKIIDVVFRGGCSGNLQGISVLVKGMEVKEAIAKLKGIKCGFKSTSCPDQLARALETVDNL